MSAAPKCSEIGNLFASQYYPHLVSSPESAHNFYHAEAGFSRLRGSTPSETSGHDNIKAYIASYNYPSCKLRIDTIDSQEKGKNEIVVLVSGIEIDGNKVVRPFCQTFYLEAPSGTRYLIRNDILCYLRTELLNIGDQKVEAQPEATETATEESAEIKDEQPLPISFDTGAQVEDTTNSTSVFSQEEPEQTPQPTEGPASAQIQNPQPHKSTRADTKKEVDPSKPRPWASLFSSGTQANTSSEAAPSGNSDSLPNDEESVASAPTTTTAAVEKPKTAPRAEFVQNSLYVSNLSPGCDVEEIKEIFSGFGKVKAVKYNSPATWCFIDFDTSESADKALKSGPLKLGDVDLKLERRKVNNAAGRGGWTGGSRGGTRGRGGAARDSRPEQARPNERRDSRETRPREGNDRSGGNRSSNKEERGGRGGRGRGGGRGGAAPTTSS